MLELARHYAHVRSAHPTDRLLVVFEIGGPIVDQRHIVRRRLLDYDRVHGTNHFAGVEPAEVDVDAGNLERFITRQGLSATVAREILDWCRKRASSTEHGPGTVRPYPGALEVIRWFQLQESTFVGLNTSRPERLRADTLVERAGATREGPVPRRPAPHEPVGRPG
jgi:phosphoglycolate phosphatase-like HAD superfamily hydrolase